MNKKSLNKETLLLPAPELGHSIIVNVASPKTSILLTVIIPTLTFLAALVTIVWLSYDHWVIDRAMIGITNFTFTSSVIDQDRENFYLQYNISNYGKYAASDLRVDVYTISIDADFLSQKSWSEVIPNTIFPQTTIPPFGHDIISVTPTGRGKSVALIFDLSYKDKLGQRNNQLWYKYTMGNHSIGTLIKSEQEKILEKYEKLKNDQK